MTFVGEGRDKLEGPLMILKASDPRYLWRRCVSKFVRPCLSLWVKPAAPSECPALSKETNRMNELESHQNGMV